MYFWVMPTLTSGSGVVRHGNSGGDMLFGRLAAVSDREPHVPLVARRILHSRCDQAEEVSLDPFAGEIVRNGKGEGLVGELHADGFCEPRPEGRLVERPPQTTRNFVPQTLGVSSV